MHREANIQIHFIDDENDQIVLWKLASHTPRVGDEIRFGGVGKEKFYEVVRVVWVYDEDEQPTDRVNIGVTKCT